MECEFGATTGADLVAFVFRVLSRHRRRALQEAE